MTVGTQAGARQNTEVFVSILDPSRQEMTKSLNQGGWQKEWREGASQLYDLERDLGGGIEMARHDDGFTGVRDEV